jgi:acyl-CoA reductase-like NAD-dependent aldehyde dehydrogenase
MLSAEGKVYKNFIDGKWVEANLSEYYKVCNPAIKDEEIASISLAGVEDVEEAVKSAYAAFQSWRKVIASERAEYIYRFIELLEENTDRLGEALCKEQGKPLKEAISEVTRGVKEVRFIAGESARLDGITLPSDRTGVTNTVFRVPIGVVAAITPWNFPVITPLRKIIPALIAGCTVVFKPATNTPLTAVILVELLEEAGLPAGTVNLILGRGGKVGNALVGHPLVKGISFTGSTVVGRNINLKAANNFTKVQLEMGGKNPVIVADYSKLENAAVQIVSAAFANAGQRCTAISRAIVLEKHADELERHIIEKVRQLKVGNGMDMDTQIGPVIGPDALETISSYVDSAVNEGAVIALGGKRLTGGIYDKGWFFEPTIITNVTANMRVAKEEIFGPVLVCIRAKSFEEAIDISNNTEYGLAASIFTDRMDYAYAFAQDVESGMLHINHGTVSEYHMPFGGVKNSGLGTYSIGSTNKDFYTELKVIYTQYR